jgi:hypothetical protein
VPKAGARLGTYPQLAGWNWCSPDSWEQTSMPTLGMSALRDNASTM